MAEVIKTKNCKNCSVEFPIYAYDAEFYTKMDVPQPSWCPFCRNIRRHGWINDYVFYTRTCDSCEKPFVAIFPQDSEYKVICQECWISEERDDKFEGRDYDFSRSFFEQFDELNKTAPQLGIIGMHNENCDFCESTANCKNCYLISECSNDEDCTYGYWLQKSKDCVDCCYIHECEQCYELSDSFNCYNVKFSSNSENCSDSWFLDNCIGCKNCFFCTNLRHQEFCIANKKYTEEEYFEKLQEYRLHERSSLEKLREDFEKFLQEQPRKALQMENCENSLGDYMRNAKNCYNTFHCYDAEECRYGEHIWRGAKYCMDSNSAGRNAELSYECTNSGINSYNVKFCRYCWGCHNTEYSNQCKNGKYLFGCVGLKPGASFCILNKQYSEDEWHETVKKIKEKMRADGEYGEFFPLSISIFGYNNSISYDDFSLSCEEVLAKGWKWENTQSGTRGKGTYDMENLPETIGEVGDNMLEEVFTCADTGLNYKMIKRELEFYRKHNLPMPNRAPDTRQRLRLAKRNKKQFNASDCSKCAVRIYTTLDPEKYTHILCDKCYKKEVY